MDHLEHVRLELAGAVLEQTCEKYFIFFLPFEEVFILLQKRGGKQ